MSSPSELGASLDSAPAGVIHDLGYRPYAGPRLGEGPVAWAFFLTGLRNSYGLGRSGRSKVLPMILLAMMLLPALILVGVLVQAQDLLDLDQQIVAYSTLPDHHAAADLGLRRRAGAGADLPRPAVPHDHALPRPADAALGLRAGAAGLADGRRRSC